MIDWTYVVQSKPEAGGSFSMFGGGVKGTYVSLERPTKVVQKWSLSNPSWPSGKFLHHSIACASH